MLGRNSSNLKSGIVGLANIGKSTLFQAITNSKLGNPANYPFATIDPLDYRIQLPNEKLNFLKNYYNSKKIINSSLTLFDIAGLTRGASSGQGLGNKFLNDIKSVDSILHVVRGFKDDEIIHLEKSVDPVRDIVLINDELILKDLEFLESGIERLQKIKNKNVSNHGIDLEKEINLLTELQNFLYDGRKIIHYKKDWSQSEIEILNRYNFLTAKPTLILLNVNPDEFIMSKFDSSLIPAKATVENWLKENSPGDKLLLFSGRYETQYNNLKNNGTDSKLFDNYCKQIVEENDLEKKVGMKIVFDQLSSAVPQVITETKKLLDLISFYTCGEIEIREWLIKNGTSAAEAAGSIHTDLQKTFLNAEIIKFQDLVNAPDEHINQTYLKSKGLIKRVGKKYTMEDNDIALFKATASKK